VAAFSRVNLRGPELDEYAQDLIERLASDLFDEFCEFVAARNAVKLAMKEYAEPTQYQLDRVAETRDDLMAEIDTALRLPPAEGRIVADLLMETVGRIGISQEAA
jgi:hypothetical protein